MALRQVRVVRGLEVGKSYTVVVREEVRLGMSDMMMKRMKRMLIGLDVDYEHVVGEDVVLVRRYGLHRLVDPHVS